MRAPDGSPENSWHWQLVNACCPPVFIQTVAMPVWGMTHRKLTAPFDAIGFQLGILWISPAVETPVESDMRAGSGMVNIFYLSGHDQLSEVVADLVRAICVANLKKIMKQVAF